MGTGSRGGVVGPVLVVLGAMLWGTTGTSQALLGPGVDPVGVGGLRLLIGTITLTAVAFLRARHALLSPPRATSLGWLIAGGLGVSGYQLTFFAAVQRTGVAVGTLIMLATSPLVAGLLGWAIQQERPTPAWAAGTTVALAGCTLLVVGARGAVRADPVGIGLAMAAGVCFGLYSVAGRALMSRGADGLASTSWIFLVALAVLVWPLARADVGWAMSPRSAILLAWLGMGATAVAYLLYQAGLASVPAATASTLALAEPLTASVLSVVVLREPLTPVSLAGIALVLAGLGGLGVVSSRGRGTPRGRPAS